MPVIQVIWYLIYLLGIINNINADNYPNTGKIQMCTKLLNTIDLRLKICQPLPDGGWESASEENCKKNLKEYCPEFNKAECVWAEIDMTKFGKECGYINTTLAFPSCRLKYYAHKGGLSPKTWMEVMYVNQFGTTSRPDTLFYIIEIKRNTLTSEFKNKEQGDFPLSVPDSSTPGGYEFNYFLNFTINKKGTTSICPNGIDKDNICTDLIRENFLSSFKYSHLSSFPPSRIQVFCFKEMREDPKFQRIVEDVCKIQVKNFVDGVTYNIYQCMITASVKPNPKENIKIDYRCTGGN